MPLFNNDNFKQVASEDKEKFIKALVNDIATSHKKPIEIIKNVLKNNKLARIYFRYYGVDEFLPVINNNIEVNQYRISPQELIKIIDNPRSSINERVNPKLNWYKKYEKELIDQGFEAEFNIAGDNLITIEIIGVPKEMHGKGYGSIIMNNLINYADKNNIVLQLRPAASSTHSRAKLIHFYSKFGFIENKGKASNDNYQYMYRLPKNAKVDSLVEKILKEVQEEPKKKIKLPIAKLVVTKNKFEESLKEVLAGETSFNYDKPIMVAYMPELKKYFLQDGNHRVIERLIKGEKEIQAFINPYHPKMYEHQLNDSIINIKDAVKNFLAKDRLKEAKENKKQYDYAIVKANVDFPELKEVQSEIDKDELYQDESNKFGLENNPHVTLLYGIHKEVTFDEVKEVIDKLELPDEIKITGISKFENENYDVLKFDVDSTDLSKINSALRKLPYTNDYDEYKPHITIAYLKPGEADKYISKNYNNTKKISIKTIDFKEVSGKKHILK